MNNPSKKLIPKVIHYCWFGGNPLPPLAEKCIASWKKYLPDYEVKRWDESNFDVNQVPYSAEAYEAKKYAFVSDYARFKILYEEGGLYFDTDVEIIKPMDEIIALGPFIGCENKYVAGNSPIKLGVNAGLGLGAWPQMELFKEIIYKYSNLHFKRRDGSFNKTTVVTYVTRILTNHGLKNVPQIQKVCGITVFPVEYFCPLDYISGELKIHEKTVSIHHYTASWKTKKDLIKEKIANILPDFVVSFLISVRKKLNE